jgi:hypothetical protein
MTDDHHDNRYEDGEPIPTTDWDFVPEGASLRDLAFSISLPALAAELARETENFLSWYTPDARARA